MMGTVVPLVALRGAHLRCALSLLLARLLPAARPVAPFV
jgi:hypothetical protein